MTVEGGAATALPFVLWGMVVAVEGACAKGYVEEVRGQGDTPSLTLPLDMGRE